MNEKEKYLISELFEKQVGGRLSQEEADQLEKLILGNEEAEEFYFDLSLQNAGLEDNKINLAGSETQKLIKVKPSPLPIIRIAVAAALVLGLSLGYLLQKKGSPEIATLTDVNHCKWSEGTLPTAKDSKLTPGTLRLEEGVASIRFSSGVKMQLAAPVHIELISDMKCIVHKGTVMADVPENAKGFTIDTPTAKVIDHGTRFLVSHSPNKPSYVEVLEGEVEVSGNKMTDSQMLTTGQRVLVKEKELNSLKADELYEDKKEKKEAASKTVTLFSSQGQGKEYEVIRVNRKQVHYNPEIIMLKNSECGWARKGYVRFDLNGINLKDLNSVSLNLNMVETGVGFACFVDDSTFDIYGLNDGSSDNWKNSDMKWETAPGTMEYAGGMNKSKTVLLGSFDLPKGIYSKKVTLNSEAIKNFILKDKNKLLTFVIVRRNKELERHGLAHGFASSQNPKYLPPRLVFEYK